MRLQIGDPAKAEETPPETEGWQIIHSPRARVGYWLAALIGLALSAGLCIGIGLLSWVVHNRSGMSTAADSATPWGAILIVLVIYIPLHELLHLLGQPEWGRSSRSVVVVWPARLRFGVYYEGCMSRRRWIGMRLLPLVVLSVLPAGLLALLQMRTLSIELEIGLQVLVMLNTLGSGGDVFAVLLVLKQVPPSGQLCFQAGRAYWRTT